MKLMSYEIIVLGATFTAAGIAQKYKEKCLIMERSTLAGYEFLSALNFGTEYSCEPILDEAKISGIKCVFNFIDEMNSRLDMPCILMGDFNSTPDSETIKYCNSRADLRDVTTEISSTCHDFGKREDPFKIDYIYMSNEFADKVTDVCVWDDVSSGIYLSDHYPVCAKLEF